MAFLSRSVGLSGYSEANTICTNLALGRHWVEVGKERSKVEATVLNT